MTATQQELNVAIKTLPPAYCGEVLDFVKFLQAKYGSAPDDASCDDSVWDMCPPGLEAPTTREDWDKMFEECEAAIARGDFVSDEEMENWMDEIEKELDAEIAIKEKEAVLV